MEFFFEASSQRRVSISRDSTSSVKLDVYWALDHTVRLAPGGVGGAIKLAVLAEGANGWRAELFEQVGEQAQYVSELEAHIGTFTRSTIEDAQSSAPPQPEPAPE